ncbi:hypothetical protein B0H34DRAFT_673983 [Crassisporium funariophilum]|nr:hypothetical protein B0H34DRAFT_673983 [Crassisporium funariophilum]
MTKGTSGTEFNPIDVQDDSAMIKHSDGARFTLDVGACGRVYRGTHINGSVPTLAVAAWIFGLQRVLWALYINREYCVEAVHRAWVDRCMWYTIKPACIRNLGLPEKDTHLSETDKVFPKSIGRTASQDDDIRNRGLSEFLICRTEGPQGPRSWAVFTLKLLGYAAAEMYGVGILGNST